MSDVALAEETWLQRLETSGALKSLESPHSDRRQPEILANILEDMERGASISAAATARGISPATASRWRKECKAFNSLCKQAAATRFAQCEVDIASNKDWKAKMSWLRARSKDMAESDWQAEQSQGHSGITVNITVRQDDTPSLVDVTPATPVLGADKD